VGDRSKWAVLAVLLGMFVLVVVVVIVAGGSGSGGDGGRLVVERGFVPGTKQPELLVSVNRDLNVAETAANGRTVGIVCTDSAGRNVIQARTEWPLIEEQGYPLPHAHQPATNQELARIEECRITGATVALRGRLRLRN
jgi:hypothetical protein